MYEKKPDRSSIQFVDRTRDNKHQASECDQESVGSVAPQIFSKAQEFGAGERNINSKLACLDSLLHNYNGISDLKNNFAKMMYSSQSNFVITGGAASPRVRKTS